MTTDSLLIGGMVVLLIFGNHLVQRFNRKRKLATAAALVFALNTEGVEPSKAFWMTAHKYLGKDDIKAFQVLCESIGREAKATVFADKVVDKVFDQMDYRGERNS